MIVKDLVPPCCSGLQSNRAEMDAISSLVSETHWSVMLSSLERAVFIGAQQWRVRSTGCLPSWGVSPRTGWRPVWRGERVCAVVTKHTTPTLDFSPTLHISHRCGPGSIPGLGRGRMCEKFHQLLAVGRWFPPGTPVSSTRKLISSSFHRLDMTLAVAEALNPSKPNQTPTLAKFLR